MKIDQLKNLLKEKRFSFIGNLHQEYPDAVVHLVGGAVRDILLNYPITQLPNYISSDDLDFVVEGIKRDELESFLEKNGTVKDVESRAFGVFIFVPKKQAAGSRQQAAESFDVALPRDEHWIGGGYKDIEIRTEGLLIKDDLSRRDFTINAMAIDLRDFVLIDEFGGQKDLKNKIVRTVGQAEDRFQEDPSRILRGLRFAVQLGFEIEKQTLAAMKKLAAEIRKPLQAAGSRQQAAATYRVAEEVIAKEFLKPFAKNPAETLKLYDKVGLLKLLLPEVKAMQKVEQPKNFHSEGDVYQHTLLALQKLASRGCHSRPVCHSRESHVQFREMLRGESRNLYGVNSSGNPRHRGSRIKCGMTKKEKLSINLKLAILFHDIGKPATMTLPKDKNDRIHFNEHDEVGAKIAKKIIKRLKLTSMSPESGLHVDDEIVLWLVKKHMILITAKPEEMRLVTFEKYFFREDGAGDDLLRLSWADISATIPPSGNPDFSIYDAFIKKIDEVRAAVHAAKKERTLPPPLINGNQVMKSLKIKGGPEVGKVLAEIRELQLAGELKTKKEALLFLSKYRQNKGDEDAENRQPS